MLTQMNVPLILLGITPKSRTCYDPAGVCTYGVATDAARGTSERIGGSAPPCHRIQWSPAFNTGWGPTACLGCRDQK